MKLNESNEFVELDKVIYKQQGISFKREKTTKYETTLQVHVYNSKIQ